MLFAPISLPELATEEPDQITTPLKSDKSQPIRMYISSDIYEKKDVPAPSTVDGKYVSYNLGSALTLALAEIAERRPWDPIEYLAHWLYKYRENIDFNKKVNITLQHSSMVRLYNHFLCINSTM